MTVREHDDLVEVFEAKTHRGWVNIDSPRFYTREELLAWLEKEAPGNGFTAFRNKIPREEAERTVHGGGL